MKKNDIIFETDRINYVRVNEELIDDYLDMLNNIDVQNKISHEIKNYNREGEQGWVKDKQDNLSPCFSMIEKNTGDFIGNIEILKVIDGVGEIGICITPSKQKKGYGQESIKGIMKYGQEKLDVFEYDLNVYVDNTLAINCYHSIGFLEDGNNKKDGEIHMKFIK